MSGPDAATQVRALCLRFPEASEQETWGRPTYRVRNKIFAMFGEDEEDTSRRVITLKAAPGEQASLLAEAGQFFYPKYVGAKGWVGVYLDAATDWDEIAELIEESYRVIAPKRLAARLDLD